MQLLIKGARVVDPSRNIDGRMDILINDGRIAQLGDNLDSPGARVLDASGLVAAPGLVDRSEERRVGKECRL